MSQPVSARAPSASLRTMVVAKDVSKGEIEIVQAHIRAGLIGGAAGTLATIPMTAVMLLAQKLGYLGEAPPRLITSAAISNEDQPPPDLETERAASAVTHFGFGAASGTLFGLLASAVRLPGSRIIQGVLFACVVWLVSYKGWVPALNIMPPPEKDRPDRPIVMILAHLVFGATLGWLVDRWAD